MVTPGKMTALPAALPPDTTAVKRVLEAVLLSTREPLSLADLRRVFADQVTTEVLRGLLDELHSEWRERPLELLSVASGWRFRTRAEYMPYLERLHLSGTAAPGKTAALFTCSVGNAGHHRLSSAGDAW